MTENRDLTGSFDLTGKRALITAAASGIGEVTARTLSTAGAKVFISDINAEGLAKTAQDMGAVGSAVCDVSKSAEVDALFEAGAKALGGLDIFINNAGVAGPTAPVEEISEEDWDFTHSINVKGQFLCVRRAVPLIRAAGGGSIVNLSSAAGIFGFPLRTPYSASKWACIGFTKTLAMELGKDKIRVNAICPGAVEGERIDRVIAAKAEQRGIPEAEMRAELVKDTSLRSFVTAEDIANQILFLVSRMGERISGQAISVNAGLEVLR